MKYILTAVLTITTLQLFGQINLKDSTVQVIGFWDNNEKQVYSISLEKLKIKKSDTTSRDMIKYEVEITVKDSTANSYLVEWHYKDFSIDTKNKFMQRLGALSENIKVLIRTNEMGTIQEVVNWEEVRDYMKSTMKKLKADFKEVPKIDDILAQVETLYSSKQSIENTSILDAQQFYTFHGAKYKLGETLEYKSKGPNIFGGEPFDVDVLVYLDEINEENNNYIMRASQKVDPKQLTDATVKYLTDLSKKVGGQPFKRDDLKDLANDIQTASRIHGTGWLVYSVQTKTVTSDNTTNVEERIIEIK